MTNSAIEAWREQVLAFDRDMEAIRKEGHESGQGRPVFASVPQDPYRADDAALNTLYEILGEGAEVLDVGGGAGRFALPLATRAKSVTVVDPSTESLELLRTRISEFGFDNLTAVHERWEDSEVPQADLVFASLVLHHTLEAPPFLRKMEESARDRVAILEMVETPGSVTRPFYDRVYGWTPAALPGIQKLLNLLWEMGIYPDVKMIDPQVPTLGEDRGAALERLRRMLAVEEGSDADKRLLEAADDLLEETDEGLTVRGVKPWRQAIIAWRPEGDGSRDAQ